MLSKILLLSTIFFTLPTTQISADSIDFKQLNGSWYLQVLDGREVQNTRAILDFDTKNMKLKGFDGCNRIFGNFKKNVQNMYTSQLMTTRMACRENIQRYVSKRLQETVSETFSIEEEKKYRLQGITLKSAKHELFFKRMEKE